MTSFKFSIKFVSIFLLENNGDAVRRRLRHHSSFYQAAMRSSGAASAIAMTLFFHSRLGNSPALYGGLGNNNTVDDTSAQDQLSGGAGNDLLSANEGANKLCGGERNDTLYSGQQNDTLSGGSGDDWLFGDLGDDLISGGTGSDRFIMSAETGFDQLIDFQVGQDFLVLAQGLTFTYF